MGVGSPCALRQEGRDTVTHGLMNRSGTPGMGVPLAEGACTVPVGYALPADYGNPSGVKPVEGDARTRQGCTGNILLPPSVGGIPVGGDPHCHNQLQYVSNGPGPPLLEVLAGSNFEDAGWISVLQHLASPVGTEAYCQALAPCVVGAQCQSDGNIGQFVTGISGMCTPHPGACQCGVRNPAGFRCSAGFAGPGCLGNPGCASRPVVTVEGHCANSGGVLPENVRVCGSNMPHPMGSARVG